MSFVNSQYLIYILVAIILMLLVFMRHNKKYFEWINSYWFLNRSIASYASSSLYYISLILFLFSLLDLRGPEKKIKGSFPDQRTIIVIDSSLSMLCEDVRPNRFSKAIQLARHFVKSSAGHQLSIVLFSDTQKRLIPFTDDIDLVDSRLAALENINSVGGGSNISQAISEASAYFEADDEKGGGGNILLFTDAEESDGEFKISVPSNVNLAVVGIGTSKGGNIPLRYEDGSFKGYKSKNSQPVTTRLDESYIKSLGKNVKNYSYWIANSYSLPTEDILSFFRATFNKVHSNGDMRIRPVFSHLILIPAIVLYCLSVLLGRLPTFRSKGLSIIIFLIIGASGVRAEEGKISADLSNRLEKMKSGESSHVHTLKTAEKMLRENKTREASEIYSEYLKQSDDEKAKFNYATSLLKQGKVKEASAITQDILKNSKDELLKSKLRKNISLALKAPKEKQKSEDEKKSDENKDQDNKNNNDQKDSKDSKDQKEGNDPNKKNDKENKDSKNKKENQDSKDNSGKNEDNKKQDKQSQSGQQQQSKPSDKDQKENKDDKKEQDKGKGKDKKDKKDKQNNKDQGEDDENKDEQKSPSSLEEKEKQIEQKRRMTKMPGMIKQIMNDDRELQKKLMDTSTKEKGELKPKNDW